MAFRGKVDDGVNGMFLQQGLHQRPIANVPVHKAKVRLTLHRRQAGEIPRIGQGIQNHHSIQRVAGHPVVDKIGADKSGAARD
jgi:hypothetical protein